MEAPAKLDSTQFGFHDNESSILQLINGSSKNLQKLLRYFSDTSIFTLFLFAIRLDLYFNDDELFGIWLPSTIKSVSPSISSLLNCHKLPEVSIIITAFNQIVYRHCNINMFCFINKSLIYFCSTFCEWCAISKCHFCIIISSNNSNISYN